MTSPLGASDIGEQRLALEKVIEIITHRAVEHNPKLTKDQSDVLREQIRGRISELLDTWTKIATREQRLQYQKEIDNASPLLLDAADPSADKESLERRKFKAQRSLRDVEFTVQLRVRDPYGNNMEDES
ncbi:hypothetical protein [Chroococcus sp. FPU101]|uniref:hypothetical protein n=1 Tax=Chroococcus sp. FPU101 TaxID=1974212 RepID=UPI001F5D83EF|nr:hypothetical protein [Chroococcus sp. FPU101]